ncbi:MAG TPA: nickel pincer cofactor biosynthesis protein LarC [Gemmatimonadaceae bacterium]|jgi:hypothetical protein|nr:nickel pincer cofactor biosynthesis protein LarC [Gemmatimonadaceae bacterium]
MRSVILDPFSGIAGDMTLAALIDIGLDAGWVRALPAALGLEGVGVDIRRTIRGDIACQKVDFDIPPQPHGRHISQIRRLVEQSQAPSRVRALADATFTSIATVEGEIHGVSAEKVHLHEVGAVDAILDVVGVIWGLELLGVERVHCGPISLGDGTVKAAHGILPVPAPATLKLLEGHPVRPGPENSGELVTPTGAALVKTLSVGAPPAEYTPLRSGYGAGTKEFVGRANVLRIILADVDDRARDVEYLIELACDVDDMTGEYQAAVADRIRDAGALDVVLVATTMKRGRPGVRFEILSKLRDAARLEEMLLVETTTLGVRRRVVERRSLPRKTIAVALLGDSIAVKVATLPNGERRAKPEFVDVQRVALATDRPLQDISKLAAAEAERLLNE